jgi:histidyl-tRNA synthetase
MAIKPDVPRGFGDTEPIEALEIERIQEALREAYRTFGFMPLDTPSVEYREVLTGSESGIAGDNQIFTVANIDYRRAESVTGPDGKEGYVVPPELGLRFDLTVPLARYVAKHGRELTFPFKRYHIGKVWRGERPQEGRYREFIQCDVDTIANRELTPYDDAEALATANYAFEKLGITDHFFKVNNRRAVQELLRATVGEQADAAAVLRVLDKREKVGDEAVLEELKSEAGIDSAQAKTLLEHLDAGYEKGLSDEFDAAVDELNEYVEIAVALGVPRERITVDPSLARGLGYYTGNVVETFIEGAEGIGSVCSGGRFDNLTENFGSQRYPGTGLSIGLSRLQAALASKGAGTTATERPLDLYLGVFSPDQRTEAYKLLATLRAEGVSVVSDPTENRPKKVMRAADRSPCRYAVVIGENEVSSGKAKIKDLESGQETEVSLDELATRVRELRDAGAAS